MSAVRTRWVAAAALAWIAAPAVAVTDTELQHCRAMGDAAARLACYDALAPQPIATLPPAATASSADAAVSVPHAAPSAPAATAAPVAQVAPVTPVAPAAPAAPAVPVTPVTPSEANFGAEALRRRDVTAASPEQLQARVVGSVDTLFRGSRLKLDNGQVWQYLDSRELLLDLRDPAVTIERNFIGSYWMRFDGLSTSIKVKRIQ